MGNKDKVVVFGKNRQINLHRPGSYTVIDQFAAKGKSDNIKVIDVAKVSSSGVGGGSSDIEAAAASAAAGDGKKSRRWSWRSCSRVECHRNPRVRRFYTEQDELIKGYLADEEMVRKFEELVSPKNLNPVIEENVAAQQRAMRIDKYLSVTTLVCNLLLMLIKAVAVWYSASLSVISSLIDSLVDLTAGAIIFCTNRSIQSSDPWRFPRGRTRLEPLSIVIVAVIMGIASFQVVIEAIRKIISGDIVARVDQVTISLMCTSVAVKIGLLIACYKFKTANTVILAIDQRNDAISISVAIICACLAAYVWIYADPIGAILVGLSIAVNWGMTGWEQIPVLSGHVAKRRQISRVLKLTLDHDPRIRHVDSIFAYYYAAKFLVEVDIVLDRTMPLHQAHDISERLQRKIEHLPFVERCFVHCDYEAGQSPDIEHKVV